MKLTMDSAGRIVLPKAIRDRLGLKAGMQLEVSEGADGLVMRPVEMRPSLERRGNLLVYVGELPEGVDVLKAIEDDREARMRKVLGV